MTTKPPTKEDDKETVRVEAFSDGVFAVAITLLVLEIKVPHEELAQGLLQLWPSFIAYALGFATIFVMWLNHHRLFQMISRVDDVLLFLNGLLLLFVTFSPFVTAVLAEHLRGVNGRTAALLYTGNSIFIAIFFVTLWRYAAKGGRLLGHHVDRTKVDALTRQYSFGPLYYVFAFLVAWFWSAKVSVGICMALALWFSLPLSHFQRK